MDPQKLKKLYDDKKAAKAAAIASETEANNKAQNERTQRDAEGKAAIKNVVIPYLAEIEAAIGKEFVSRPIMETGNGPIGVSFTLGRGGEYTIQVASGNVTVSRRAPRVSGVNPVFVFSGDKEPFIKGVDDLTREKVGKLVEMAISGNLP